MGQMASPLERALRILELLKEHAWTPASTLAKELKVSERTVYRYLRQIDLAFGGYPIFESSTSGYRLARNVLEDVWSGRDDMAVAAAILACPYAQAPKGSSERIERFMRALQSHIRVERKIPKALLQPLFQCFIERRISTLDYRLSGKSLTIPVLPLRIVAEHEIYYLQAQDIATISIKLFAFDKINRITTGEKEPDAHNTEKLLQYLDSAWGIMVSGTPQKVIFEADED